MAPRHARERGESTGTWAAAILIVAYVDVLCEGGDRHTAVTNYGAYFPLAAVLLDEINVPESGGAPGASPRRPWSKLEPVWLSV